MMLFPLVLASKESVFKAYVEAEKSIVHLREATFDHDLKGLQYLVFFGAKWCGHCQKMTPVWLQLQEWQTTAVPDVHLGKIECTQNEELCADMNGFPTVNWYSDGKIVEECTAQDLPGLKDCVYKASKNVKQGAYERLVKSLSSAPSISNQNPQGDVVDLTPALLSDDSPWLVMFYAPWCGHCQEFKPTFFEIGKELKNKINVGKVDCTTQASICDQHKIQGYPTLGILHNKQLVLFKGSRNKDAVVTFATTTILAPSLEPVQFKMLQDLLKEKDVLYTYVYSSENENLDELKLLAEKVKYSVGPIYICPEKKCLEHFKLEAPTLVVIKGGELSIPYKGVAQGTIGQLQMIDWVLKNKDPLVFELDSSTEERLLRKSKELLILGVLDPDSVSTHKKYLFQASRALQQEGFTCNVAWIDAVRFQGFVTGTYKLKMTQLPTLLILNPSRDEYFASFSDGSLLAFTIDGILSAMNQIKQKKMTALSVRGNLGRIMIAMYDFVFSFSFLILAFLTSICLFFYSRRSYDRVPEKDNKNE